jgi:proteasome lid subunit RPN8/RPN11
MNAPKELLLTQAVWNDIARHAQSTFPEECCGVVLSSSAADQAKSLKNIQNKLHALDPLTYPRTAAIAYAMDPLELDAVIQAAAVNGQHLKAFYHSHPDHEAYFSDEDKIFACPFGEPTFADAAQIVISIYDRTVKTIKAFVWSDARKDFIETPIRRT